MTKIKIISNPYKQEIKYETYRENSQDWIDVGVESPNGKLREEKFRKCFFPFNVKEILETIVNDYYMTNKGKVEIIFEGTKEEYGDLVKVIQTEKFQSKFIVINSKSTLDNAKFILNEAKEEFNNIKPVIEKVIDEEKEITKNLKKVSDALDDIVPICVFGNYSSGKSTFINALIGKEILPSGGDPVTAKTFKIQNSSQEDLARIKFSHFDKEIELSFEDNRYRVTKGDTNDELLVELANIYKENELDTLNKLIATTLELINNFDKRDPSSTEIGNIIELYIAFSKTGIVGSSNNKFVIFDTPGSNTATNDKHIEVLKEALEGFSNGIPVWVSQYESIDSTDNEVLCNNILNIEALDTRFTMIVLNKADVSDLPEHEFNDKQIMNIKEFKSVEKMYASGIFFVSSIMCLGAKNDGVLLDRNYRKIYKHQSDIFNDPQDEDYMELYKYNIMPLQIKEEVIEYSINEKNLVYVNSGLHCVEKEIEDFASKYSAYNKCQMVNALLANVVDKTTEKITRSIQNRQKLKNKYHSDFEEKRQQLLDDLKHKREKKYEDFLCGAHKNIVVYAKNNFVYNISMEELNQLNKKYDEENTNQFHLDDKKNDTLKEFGKMTDNLKNRTKDFSFLDFKESFSKFVTETKKDIGYTVDSGMDYRYTKKKTNAETSSEVLEEVKERYNVDLSEGINKVNNLAFKYWYENAKELKKELIKIITICDDLTDQQKELLSTFIMEYGEISYDDQTNEIFAKPKFLQGNFCGVNLFTIEKLRMEKIENEYRTNITKSIEKIADDLNQQYHKDYTQWQEVLSKKIEQHIAELNSDLKTLAEQINNEEKLINFLKTSKDKILTTQKEIESLISFKINE